MKLQDRTSVLLVRGTIGIVDVALVRWLIKQRARTDRLLVHVMECIFEPLLPRKHIEKFLAALEPVDEVVQESALEEVLARSRTAPDGVSVVTWPAAELLNYSVDRICKRQPLVEEEIVSRKLISLDRLCAVYGPRPRRPKTAGIVSGTFDLIHPGHIRLFVAAKQMVDVLVVLTMSSAAIRQQEKNQLGDRPIYNCRDRIEVLSALRPVDHIVMFDDLDGLSSLRAFCPDYFIKSAHDRSRAVVEAEATLVENLGGKAVFLTGQPTGHTGQPTGYSSTAIIQHVRQQAETREIVLAGCNITTGVNKRR